MKHVTEVHAVALSLHPWSELGLQIQTLARTKGAALASLRPTLFFLHYSVFPLETPEASQAQHMKCN